MLRWLLWLIGPLVWLAHFLGLYGLASLADLSPHLLPWRSLGLGYSVVCLGLCAPAVVRLWRMDISRILGTGFARVIAFGGLAISSVAIVWQTLPLVLSP